MCSLQISGGTNCRAKPFFFTAVNAIWSSPLHWTDTNCRAIALFSTANLAIWGSFWNLGFTNSRAIPVCCNTDFTKSALFCILVDDCNRLMTSASVMGKGIATTLVFFPAGLAELCKARQLKQMMGPPICSVRHIDMKSLPTSIATKSQDFFNLHMFEHLDLSENMVLQNLIRFILIFFYGICGKKHFDQPISAPGPAEPASSPQLRSSVRVSTLRFFEVGCFGHRCDWKIPSGNQTWQWENHL